MVLKERSRVVCDQAGAFSGFTEMLILNEGNHTELIVHLNEELGVPCNSGAVLHQEFGSSGTGVLHLKRDPSPKFQI